MCLKISKTFIEWFLRKTALKKNNNKKKKKKKRCEMGTQEMLVLLVIALWTLILLPIDFIQRLKVDRLIKQNPRMTKVQKRVSKCIKCERLFLESGVGYCSYNNRHQGYQTSSSIFAIIEFNSFLWAKSNDVDWAR